jgi:hypothetical protein
MSLFFLGRYDNGWLGDRGTINLWPKAGGGRLTGMLFFDVESPAGLNAATLDLQVPGGRQVHVQVPEGGTTKVELPVCSRGPWATGFRSKIRAFVGERPVSMMGSVPRFVPGPGGCTAEPRQTPSGPRPLSSTA